MKHLTYEMQKDFLQAMRKTLANETFSPKEKLTKIMELLQLQIKKWSMDIPQLKKLQDTLESYMDISPKPELVVILGDCTRGRDGDSKNIR